MLYATIEGLGTKLEECIADAVLAWRDEHAKKERIEDLLAEAITSVTSDLTMWRGGRATLIVTIRGRRQFDDETHVFRLRRRGVGRWHLDGSSLPSTSG